MRAIDITGTTYYGPNGEGGLTALRFVGRGGRLARWECVCVCGKKQTCFLNMLRQGRKFLCRDCAIAAWKNRMTAARIARQAAKVAETKTHAIWRCKKWSRLLCHEWLDFAVFETAVGDIAKNQRLFRADKSKPFGPGNCEVRTVTDISEFADRPVSRQRRRQLAMRKSGRCSQCGKPAKKEFCSRCQLAKNTNRLARRLRVAK